MPIDTSMYNLTPAKPFNPLETMGTAVGINQALMNTQNLEAQNRLLQAKIGLGGAFQASVDPVTGQPDLNRLSANVSGNPLTAPLYGDVQNQVIMPLSQPMQVYGANNQPQYKTRLDVQQAINPPSYDPTQVNNTHDALDTLQTSHDRLIANPNLSEKDIIHETTNLMAEHAKSGGKVGISPQAAAGIYGTLPHGPNGEPATPEEYRAWVAQHGQQIQAMRQQLPPRAPVYAGPAPGEIEATTLGMTGAVNAYNSLHENIAGNPDKGIQPSAVRLFQLQQAKDALDQTKTGPGLEGRTTAANAITALIGPQLSQHLSGIDPKSDQYFDEAKKYLTQYASGLPGAGRSDSQLATALTGNANTHISQLAAKDIVKAAIGLERMQQAQAQAFDESSLEPKDYNKWQVQWNKSVDPRAFILDQLDDAAQAKLVKSMKPSELKKLEATYNMGVQAGFIDDVAGGQ